MVYNGFVPQTNHHSNTSGSSVSYVDISYRKYFYKAMNTLLKYLRRLEVRKISNQNIEELINSYTVQRDKEKDFQLLLAVTGHSVEEQAEQLGVIEKYNKLIEFYESQLKR